MKKKYLYYALFSMLGLTSLAGFASANGFFGMFGNLTPDQIATNQQTMFQKQAAILGINIEDIKNAWAEGKTIKTLAEEKGITQEQLQTKIKDLRLQELKLQLQALVEKEVITQTQADKRLQFIQDQSANGKIGKRGMHMGLGFHGMMW